MLDAYTRRIIDKPLDNLGKRCLAFGLTANAMTMIGFIQGVIAMLLIAWHQYSLATLFLLLNRLADGLDGAIARNSTLTDLGGFLDIVSDFIIYAGIVFAFGVSNSENYPYSCFLIFSFIGPMVSFLAYAIIASKRHIATVTRGRKSFYYLGGVCEGTETFIVLFLFCVFPKYFSVISVTFAALCWVTTIGRVYRAWYDFSDEPLKKAIDFS